MINVLPCVRFLQMVILGAMLVAFPAWAGQLYDDTDLDTPIAADDDIDAEVEEPRFESELLMIERQFSDLVPDEAKSTVLRERPNDVNATNDSGDEDGE